METWFHKQLCELFKIIKKLFGHNIKGIPREWCCGEYAWPDPSEMSSGKTSAQWLPQLMKLKIRFCPKQCKITKILGCGRRGVFSSSFWFLFFSFQMMQWGMCGEIFSWWSSADFFCGYIMYLLFQARFSWVSFILVYFSTAFLSHTQQNTLKFP